MKYKVCFTCKKKLCCKFFHKNCGNRDGLQSNCMSCQATYQREHNKLYPLTQEQKAKRVENMRRFIEKDRKAWNKRVREYYKNMTSEQRLKYNKRKREYYLTRKEVSVY